MQRLSHEAIDVALLPIGGNFTMDIEDAIRAVTFIKPKVAIPIHYNTFEVIKKNPQLFINGLPKDVKGHVLQVGDNYQI